MKQSSFEIVYARHFLSLSHHCVGLWRYYTLHHIQHKIITLKNLKQNSALDSHIQPNTKSSTNIESDKKTIARYSILTHQ